MSNQEQPMELAGISVTGAVNELQPVHHPEREEISTTVISPEDMTLGAHGSNERIANIRAARTRVAKAIAEGKPVSKADVKFLEDKPPESLSKRFGRYAYNTGKAVVLTVAAPVIWPLKTIYKHSVQHKMATVGTVALGGGLAVAGAVGARAAFGHAIDYQDIIAGAGMTLITFPLASKVLREGFTWASHNWNYFKTQTYNQLKVDLAGRLAGAGVASVLAFGGGVFGKEEARIAYEAYTAIPRVVGRVIPSTAIHLFAPQLSNTRWDPAWHLNRQGRCLQFQAVNGNGPVCLAGPGSDAIQMTIDMDKLRATYGEQTVRQSGTVRITERATPAEWYTPRAVSSALFGPRFGGM